jgi:hypothetical protein
MRCFYATKGKPEGELSPIKDKAFQKVKTRVLLLVFLVRILLTRIFPLLWARICGMRLRQILGS